MAPAFSLYKVLPPFWTFRLAINAPVTGAKTVNIEKGPWPPSSVTRLLRVLPLPVVGPRMAVCVGILSELLTAMVTGALKTVESKVITPLPAAAAAASASRSEQVPSGIVVQPPAPSFESAVVFT